MAAAATQTGPDGLSMKHVQAMLGNGKTQSTAVIYNEKGQKTDLTEERVKSQHTVVFKDCSDGEYTMSSMCTKITLDNCHNMTLTVNAKVVTQITEVYKCSKLTMILNTQVKTVQIDKSEAITTHFTDKSHFQHLVWAGTNDVKLEFKDAPEHNQHTGFGHMQAKQPNKPLNPDIDQFIMQFHQGELLTEKVVRFENGFPTTMREKIEYEERQKRNMEAFAKQAGISIYRTEKKDARPPGRNEECSCGSGKKYKKCCGAPK
jgi:hypothetical protein